MHLLKPPLCLEKRTGFMTGMHGYSTLSEVKVRRPENASNNVVPFLYNDAVIFGSLDQISKSNIHKSKVLLKLAQENT